MFMPAGVIGFYRDHPSRRAATAVELPVGFPGNLDAPRPVWSCGCGPGGPCRFKKRWTRQHPHLSVERGDYISNQARALYGLCQREKRPNILYAGGAAEECVLLRPFGMHAMSSAGMRCILVSDMTFSYKLPLGDALDWIGERYELIDSAKLLELWNV
jgi:hypothetical protein